MVGVASGPQNLVVGKGGGVGRPHPTYVAMGWPNAGCALLIAVLALLVLMSQVGAPLPPCVCGSCLSLCMWEVGLGPVDRG